MELPRSCLFINDDPEERELFDKVLNTVAPDITCYLASDDVDALWLIRHENILPEYIFIELDTVCVKGVWFLQQIKKTIYLKDVPVIVHAAQPMPERVDELKRAGAFAIYFGPYQYRGLCNILNLYFHSEQLRFCLN